MLDFAGGGIVLTAAFKTQSTIVMLSLVAMFICLVASDVQAQVQARVRISVTSPNEILLEVNSASPQRSWSFRNAYAGVLGLAERIEQFRGTGGEVRKLAIGEFRSETGVNEISYRVRLSRPTAAAVAHVTWLTQEHGILMLADLLPQELENIVAEFELPNGWSVQSAILPDASDQYLVSDAEDTVFFVGRAVRRANKKGLDSFIAGSWPFKDSTVVNAAARVMEKYLALTGYKLPIKPVVMIAPLPVATGTTKWRAQTRGSTVLLLMDPQARIANWKGQLEIIFTHEVLHLWVPNALRLQGDYDWFFEGFTLYTALLTALELKAINFREYLDTMARVYDSYLSYADDLSLIDASERRWTSRNNAVYDKGMLVAFLYDLLLRKESGGRTRLVDRYRELFRLTPADRADGNEVIIKLLSSSPATADFIKAYVLGTANLELEGTLSSYGFLLDTKGSSSHLSVSKQIDEDQKQLLRSLGFRD